MNHLNVIQKEFVKSAGWRDLSQQRQRKYLKQHPKSRYRVTAPGSARHDDVVLPNDIYIASLGDNPEKWRQWYTANGFVADPETNLLKKDGQLYRINNKRLQRYPSVAVPGPARSPGSYERTIPLRQSLVPEQTIDIDKSFVAYDKQTKTLSFETSDIDAGVDTSKGSSIVLHNPKTGAKARFTQYKVDYADPTHEDIAGWWYQSDDGKFKLLVIND